MAPRRTIARTATLAWSPAYPRVAGFPQLLATGSVAGALDASFSSQAALELFEVPFDGASKDILRRVGVASPARFNRLAWSQFATPSAPTGLIAAGLETGELALYNPSQLLQQAATLADNNVTLPDTEAGVVLRSPSHSAGVRGVDFNPIQTNLLGTGAGEGEILIWDLNNPTTPYSPGPTKSPKLAGAEITFLAWNKCVPHILASSSSNGVTVVWDLKNRREVFSLNAPAPSGGINVGGSAWGGTSSGGAGPGPRRQGVVVAWHPEIPTQFVTALEDDANPALYFWDLRNAHAPLRVLSGHTKGILSVAWCPKDSDLLLSCGKDNRTLCWNPTTGDLMGEFPHSANWCFDVQWCARNPDLLSVASFDGSISIHSLLPSGEAHVAPSGVNGVTPNSAPLSPRTLETDPFAAIQPSSGHASDASAITTASISLKQPPKWLRRPCSVAFGFGARLVYISTKRNKSISIRNVPSLTSKVATMANELHNALLPSSTSDGWAALARSRGKNAEDANDYHAKLTWQVLQSLFEGDAGRRSLISMLDQEVAKANVELPDDISMENLPPRTNGAAALIQAVIHGDYQRAVAEAQDQGRDADALVLAACGGHDLFVRVRDAYLDRKSSNPLHALMNVICGGKWDHLLASSFDWRQILVVILTYCAAEDLVSLTSQLGDSLTQRGEEQGAIMCYILSGRIDRLIAIWSTHTDSAILGSPIQASVTHWGAKLAEKSEILHRLVEQVSIVSAAIGTSHDDLAKSIMASRYAEYADVLASQGYLDSAWNYLVQIETCSSDQAKPSNNILNETSATGPSISTSAQPADESLAQNNSDPFAPIQQIETVGPSTLSSNQEAHSVSLTQHNLNVLKDRVFHSLSSTGQKTVPPERKPEFPFSRFSVTGPIEQEVIREKHLKEEQDRATIQASATPQGQPGLVAGQQTPYWSASGMSAPTSFGNSSTGSYNSFSAATHNPYGHPSSSGPYPSAYNQSQIPYPSAYNQSQIYPQSNMGSIPPSSLPPIGPPSGVNSVNPSLPPPPPPTNRGWNDAPAVPMTLSRPSTSIPNAPPVNSPFPFQHQINQQPVPTSSPLNSFGTMQQGIQQRPILPPPPTTAVAPNAAFSASPSSGSAPVQLGATSPPPGPGNQYMHQPNNFTPSTSPQPSQPLPSTGLASMNQPHSAIIGAPSAVGPQNPYSSPGPSAPPAATSNPPTAPPPIVSSSPHNHPSQVQPSSSKYPPGDRTHIASEHRPIFNVLTGILGHVKQHAPANQKRVVEDADRRLQQLFDVLNNGQIAEALAQQLLAFVKALEVRDWSSATRIHQEMAMSNFDAWMIGLKRLVDVVSKM